MIVIVCLDDNNGMMFNHRRQSRDRVLLQKMLQLTAGATLWMNAYSAGLFAQQPGNICVDEDFLQQAEPGQMCFVENQPLAAAAEHIEKVLVFRWNRTYPADQWLDLDLMDGSWWSAVQEEFSGSSHEKITLEVYTR